MHDREVVAVGNGRACSPEAHDALRVGLLRVHSICVWASGFDGCKFSCCRASAMKLIASTMLRGSGSPREPGAGYRSYGTCS